jgi:hypothetical protein
MKMDHRLDKLKQHYSQVPIPDELDFIVRKALIKSSKRRFQFKGLAAVGVALLMFIIGINISPPVARAFSSIPGVDQLVKVLTIKEYMVSDDSYNADIKVPAVTNLTDKALELGLNEKYLAENEALYDQFQKDMNQLKASGNGHLGVNAGYEVKTDTEDILVIARYVVNTVGSSSTKMKYDTIDKKNQVLLSLPMLFKDDEYIEKISENISQQMISRMKEDPGKIFWIEKPDANIRVTPFKKIRADQNFYINSKNQLVISFDKYEVAPGYMGIQEFVIPTEVISDLLVSHNYVK